MGILTHSGSAVAAIVLAALPLASCRTPAPGSSEAQVVATYRGGSLTRSEFEGWREFRPMLAGEQTEARYGLQAVEMAALVEATAGLATSLGLDEEPQWQFDAAREESRILSAELKAHLTETASVDEREIRSFLADHDEDREKPERRRLRLLLKRVPAGADESAKQAIRAEVETFRERVLQGEDFAELARGASDSQTRHQGGLLGSFAREALPPALAEAAFALDEGGLSEVLESSQGFALLLCEKIVPARRMPLEEARQRILEALRRQKGDELWRQLVGEMMGGGSVENDLDLLAEAAGSPNDIVSRFEGGHLTRRQVHWLLERGGPSSAGRALEPRELERLLDSYARESLIAREARRRGLDRDPRVLRRIEWSRRAALMKAYRDREIAARFEAPDDQEVRVFFEGNRDRFSTLPRYRLAVLWDGSPPQSRAEKYRALETAVSRIELGELAFSEAARRLSSHPHANAAGEIGWRTRRQVGAWGPAALRAVEELEVGRVSPVIEEPRALWVFKLLEREEPRPLSWEEARQMAREALEQRVRSELHRDLIERLQVEQEIRAAAAPMGD